MHKIDKRDVAILDILQRDCSLSVPEVGEMVNLSQNACWRRIRHLEDEGVIQRRVALLNPGFLDVSVTAFVMIRAEHSEGWLNSFRDAAMGIPEIVELYRMSGDVDYLIKLRLKDIAAYDGVYMKLIRAVRFRDVSSFFAMEEIKFTTALPLPSL